MLFSKPKKKLKKQEALFTEALKEAGYAIQPGDVRIDHELARCYYQSKDYNLIFPLRFLRLSRQLNFMKTYDYCFRGLQTPRRDWVRQFEGERSKITFTDQGRKIEKDLFDTAYYQEMASSKFTLCPAGDFKWTYRFFEAAMCMSIPIIEPGSDHDQFAGFTYYYATPGGKGAVNEWNAAVAYKNYRTFLERHTLLNQFIFFNDREL